MAGYLFSPIIASTTAAAKEPERGPENPSTTLPDTVIESLENRSLNAKKRIQSSYLLGFQQRNDL